jgi:integrase
MPAAARKVALTDRSLRALRAAPDGRRQTIWDSLMPGMVVRVSALGKRSFYAVRRPAGAPQPVWHLLGVYPVMGLGEARTAAREALSALMAGRHPKRLAEEKRQAAEATAREAEASTFRTIAAEFERKQLPEMAAASARMYKSYLDRELIPVLGAKQIAAIQRRDVIALVGGIAERSGKSAAIGTLSVLRRCLNWAMDLDYIESNPAATIRLKSVIGTPPEARSRLLSDDELAAVWRAIPEVAAPFDTIYKLLLLLGLRLNEVAATRWDDVDLDAATLTISASRSKTGEAMLVPLPPTAVELFAAMPRFSGPFVFSTDGGRKHVQHPSAAKRRLDGALAAQGVAMPPYVIHDFRRAVRSGLGRLGVPTVVAELVLGHRQPGVVGVYDRHSYLAEKRDALMKWEKHLLTAVAPAPDAGGNVFALRA